MATISQSAVYPMVPGNNLQAYLDSVQQIPVLSREQEKDLFWRFQNEDDLEAARTLVMAHLRYVAYIAKGYVGYGIPLEDLIQQGNVGLMRSVKKFELDRDVRLITFAVHWIKAEIHDYVLKNWKLVKVATTKAQRKLFFNLRKNKEKLGWMSRNETEQLASQLNVSADDVVEMDARLGLSDRSFHAESDEDYGLFSNISLDNAGPGGTTELSRTYHNTGNEALNISMSANNVIVSPSSATIATGGSQSFSFSYTADNFTYSAHNVPSEYGTIQSAVDAAAITQFSEDMTLTTDDPYTTHALVTEYGHSGSGDTVYVSPGTYTENLVIDDKSICMISTNGDPASTIIDGNNDGTAIKIGSWRGMFTLNGFTIQNGNTQNFPYPGNIGAGLSLGRSSNDFGTVNITNNIFKDNHSGYGGAFFAWSANGTINRNLFIGNTATYRANAAYLRDYRSVIGLNFYNNTIWDTSESTSIIRVNQPEHRVINNIIWRVSDQNLEDIDDISSGATIEYNIVKNGYDGTGNISDDPQFYDPDNGDFRLGASSPAIDAGDPDLDDDGEDYSTDEDDQDPDGSRMDMGADLYRLYMLLNGSFEDGMNFWSTWNVNENITISMTGENIYNSSAVFEAYDGEQALKMWGAYNGYETYTWVGQFLEVGSGGLEIGSFIMLDGMMMSHADDWIGQGANYACLALYFYDADMTTYVGGQYMALSEFVDANAPSSEWLYRDVIAQIPEGTVWAWAGVEYYQPSNDDHGSIYVDMLQTDVNVTGGSFHNFELADDWSIVTSFTREEVGDVFSQTGSNGRTVIGGIDLDEDGLKEIILTDYVGHRVLVFEYLISTGNFDQVWSSPIIDNANHDSSPRTVGVGDLDSDSKGEIVFPVSAAGQEGWYIFEYNGKKWYNFCLQFFFSELWRCICY